MALIIKWTETALRDVEQSADYIAGDSINYAATFVSEVMKASQSLSYLSERGRVVPEFDNPAIRELFVGNYRLVYQISDEIVYIIGLVHGARDLWRMWDDEERKIQGRKQ